MSRSVVVVVTATSSGERFTHVASVDDTVETVTRAVNARLRAPHVLWYGEQQLQPATRLGDGLRNTGILYLVARPVHMPGTGGGTGASSERAGSGAPAKRKPADAAGGPGAGGSGKKTKARVSGGVKPSEDALLDALHEARDRLLAEPAPAAATGVHIKTAQKRWLLSETNSAERAACAAGLDWLETVHGLPSAFGTLEDARLHEQSLQDSMRAYLFAGFRPEKRDKKAVKTRSLGSRAHAQKIASGATVLCVADRLRAQNCTGYWASTLIGKRGYAVNLPPVDRSIAHALARRFGCSLPASFDVAAWWASCAASREETVSLTLEEVLGEMNSALWDVLAGNSTKAKATADAALSAATAAAHAPPRPEDARRFPPWWHAARVARARSLQWLARYTRGTPIDHAFETALRVCVDSLCAPERVSTDARRRAAADATWLWIRVADSVRALRAGGTAGVAVPAWDDPKWDHLLTALDELKKCTSWDRLGHRDCPAHAIAKRMASIMGNDDSTLDTDPTLMRAAVERHRRQARKMAAGRAQWNSSTQQAGTARQGAGQHSPGGRAGGNGGGGAGTSPHSRPVSPSTSPRHHRDDRHGRNRADGRAGAAGRSRPVSPSSSPRGHRNEGHGRSRADGADHPDSEASGRGAGTESGTAFCAKYDCGSRKLSSCYRQKTVNLHPDKGGNRDAFDALSRDYEAVFEADREKPCQAIQGGGGRDVHRKPRIARRGARLTAARSAGRGSGRGSGRGYGRGSGRGYGRGAGRGKGGTY